METLKEMKRYVAIILRRSVYGPSTTKTLDYQALFGLAALFLTIALKLPVLVAMFIAVSSQLLAWMWSQDVE